MRRDRRGRHRVRRCRGRECERGTGWAASTTGSCSALAPTTWPLSSTTCVTPRSAAGLRRPGRLRPVAALARTPRARGCSPRYMRPPSAWVCLPPSTSPSPPPRSSCCSTAPDRSPARPRAPRTASRRPAPPPSRTSLRLGALDGATAVHLCHATEADVALLARHARGAVTCPRSNYYLGNPPPRVTPLLEARVPVGVGTDSSASNYDLDLLGRGTRAACRRAQPWCRGADPHRDRRRRRGHRGRRSIRHAGSRQVRGRGPVRGRRCRGPADALLLGEGGADSRARSHERRQSGVSATARLMSIRQRQPRCAPCTARERSDRPHARKALLAAQERPRR